MPARRRPAVIPVLAIVAGAVLIALSMIAWNARPATAIVGYATSVDTPNDNAISGDGHCSLREAILGANSGKNTIDCGPGPITGIFFNLSPAHR